MLTNRIIEISLLLVLAVAAVSTAAHAGTTISDKRYWPNEVGPSAYSAGSSQADSNSALASSRSAPRLEAAPESNQIGSIGRYQGGPKSR